MLKLDEIQSLSFDEAMELAIQESSIITTRFSLKGFAIKCIEEGNIVVAIHILEAIKDSEHTDKVYFTYDYCMGTLETPSLIESMDDLLELDIFED